MHPNVSDHAPPLPLPSDHLAQIAPPGVKSQLSSLADISSQLGHDIVEVSGFLDHVHVQVKDQSNLLTRVAAQSDTIAQATNVASGSAQAVATAADQAQGIVTASAGMIDASSTRSISVAKRVSGFSARMEQLTKSLAESESDVLKIAAIAREVNILAVNAKIESARAGDAGRGFAVIADAVRGLALNTSATSNAISSRIDQLKSDVADLSEDSVSAAQDAQDVIKEARQTTQAFAQIADHVHHMDTQAKDIAAQTARVTGAITGFLPEVEQACLGLKKTEHGLHGITNRTHALIDNSEKISQMTVAMGGDSKDKPFIERVQADAHQLGHLLEQAIEAGQLTLDQTFDTQYRAIPGTNPVQFLTAVTPATDRLFAPVQEAALDLSSNVIFCAAVDRNGYLPTHNMKFSHPQGDDPDWNAANCRNRRIFDDRVGLKSGRNEEPFLLQIYRRDMGGGNYKMMKDLSAPIFVQGRHWGGLRLAYAL